MPYATYRYFSSALEKHTQAEILLPDPNFEGPWHVMFLLHGLSDDQSIWMRRTSIERYLDRVPLIVVMPDGGRGWYTDAEEGFAYLTAIGEELPIAIERTFHTAPGWAVSGLSMGGYGAIKLGLRFPDRFSSVVSHSGALQMGHWQPNRDDSFNREVMRIFGNNPVGSKNDLFALSRDLEPARLPALRIDCGHDDFLIDANRAFHRHLLDHAIEHEYQEFPGAHTWAYWDEHVQEGIDFHLRNLGLSKLEMPG